MKRRSTKPANKNGGTNRPTPPSLNKEQHRQRLKYASKAVESLRAARRVPKADRVVLARNLGQLCEGSLARGQDLNLANIFRAAFGDQIGESHYKKRKRYIRFSREVTGPKSQRDSAPVYAACGNDYLLLAEALAHRLPTKNGEQDETLSLTYLRLIEGTSFDDRTGIRERHEQEQQVELQSRLEQIVDRLTANVDLDWMREWTQRNHVGLSGRTGEIRDVSLLDSGGWGPMLNIHEDFEGESENRIAPCLRLASIYSPFMPIGYLPITVSSSDIKATTVDDAVRVAMMKKLGVPAGRDEDWEYDDGWPPLRSHHDWVDNIDELRIWVRRCLDIEIRFHPELDKWKCCLIVRAPRDGGWFEADRALFSNFDIYNPEASEPCLVYLGMDSESFDNVHASRVGQNGSAETYAIFHYEDGVPETIKDEFLWMDEGTFIIPGKNAFDLAFADTQVSEHKFAYEIETCAGQFTPAPHDSIAGAILRNLAYAPKDKRLDRLLIKDAAARVKLMEDLAKRCKSEYDAAITRLET
jgi:hypothetical protein